jgi:hypothetical protein
MFEKAHLTGKNTDFSRQPPAASQLYQLLKNRVNYPIAYILSLHPKTINYIHKGATP